MTWGRRTTGALALTAVAVVAFGCSVGDATEAEPTPVVIPGSTVTIGTEPVESPAQPSAPAQESTTSGPDGEVAADAAELIADLGGAMGEFETAHLSVGDEEGPSIEADHRYLGGNDFSATVDAAGSLLEFRRTGGAFYFLLDAEDGWGRAEEGDLAEGDTSLTAELAGWDVVADLAGPLTAARDFTAGGPGDVEGTAVTSYTFTVDAADVVAGAAVPDQVTGPVQVTLSVDPEGLPVRLDQLVVDAEVLVRTDYDGWGEPVEVVAPDDVVEVS